jgi:hypothetical protein
MELSRTTKNYINLLSITALMIFLISLYTYPLPSIKELVFWCILGIIGESIFVILPGVQKAGLSVASGVSTAAIIVGGPILCSITTLAGFIFRTEKLDGKYRVLLFSNPYFKNAFNCAQITITEIIISAAYVYLYGLIISTNMLLNILIAVIIITARALINSMLMSTLFSTMNDQPFMQIWKGIFRPLILPYIIIGLMGIVLGFGYLRYDKVAVLLFLGPIMLAKLCINYYLKMRQISSEISSGQIRYEEKN